MSRVNPATKLLVGLAVALVLLVLALPRGRYTETDAAGAKPTSLLVYCAASLRVPVEQIADDYRREHGVTVNLQYGGSNTLLSQIEVSRQGDLFLAADESYLAIGRQKGFVAESLPLASLKPVVAVRRGNPRSVRSLDDLLRLRVAVGNPDQTAVGKATRALLEPAGRWRALDTAVRQRGVYKPTVADVTNDVALGSVDAGIIWDAVAAQYAVLEVVDLPEFSAGAAEVAVGVLASAKDSEAALRFARYAAGADRGRKAFAEHGYRPPRGASPRSDSP